MIREQTGAFSATTGSPSPGRPDPATATGAHTSAVLGPASTSAKNRTGASWPARAVASAG
jgi:hypothetical protein